MENFNHAQNNKGRHTGLPLQAIFDEIDRLEKTEIAANVHFEHREMFIYFRYIAVALLFIKVKIITRSLFRKSLP